MCLSTIKEQHDKPSTMIQDAWKRFTGPFSAPRFESMDINGRMEVPLDEWLVAKETPLSAGSTKYQSGFHVWDDEAEAKKEATSPRRVYVRAVHTRGTQDGKTVLVAREMYVPSDPNDWPPRGPSSTWDKLKKAAGKSGNA